MGTKKLASLVVDLEARTAKFERGMDKAQAKAKKFGSSMKMLGGTIAGALAGRRILRGLQDVIGAYAVQEEAVISLGAALEVTGKQGAASLELITQRAAELQQVTTKGDEAIIAATSSLALLATELDANELADAQEALIGIADTFLKGDVEGAALLVGKSIGSTTNALTRYGIQLDTTATQQEKLKAILQKSAGFFEVSKKRTDSIAGATQQLSNAFGDLKEAIGEALSEETGFTDFLQSVTGVLSDVTSALSNNAITIGDAFGLLGKIAGTAFVDNFFSIYATIPAKMEEILEKNKIVSVLTQPLQLQLKLFESTFGRATEALAAEARRSMEETMAELRALTGPMGPPTPAHLRGGGSGGGGDGDPRMPGYTFGGITVMGSMGRPDTASVEKLLDAAIIHSKVMAESYEEGAKKMRTASDWVLEGFDSMAMAAGLFRDQTARLVVHGIGAIISALGKTDFLQSLGAGLQSFASGGIVQGPMGSPQLAVVHAGETVLPRGSGGQTVVVHQTLNWNIAAVDGQSVARWVEQNRYTIADGVARAAQDAPGIAHALRG